MLIRRLVVCVALGSALLLTACGAGSGRFTGTDVQVTGIGPSAQLNGGDPIVFTMTVTNAGDFDAEDVLIRNTTSQVSPASVRISCTAFGGAVCPPSTGSSMNVSTLPRNGVLVFNITGTLNAGASGAVTDTMTVTADSVDPDSGNNTLTVTATTTSNDVAITAAAPFGPLVTSPAVYTMLVTNAGPDAANDVVLTTSVSTDLSFSPADISCVPTAGASVPVLQADGTLLVATLPLNAVLTCSVPVTLLPAINGFAIVNMTATGIGDSRPSNNTGSASVSATLVNDLEVVGTAPVGPLTSANATFTMAISNLGPAAAPNVVITNVLGPNLTAGGPIACTSTGGAVVPTLQPDGTLLSPLIPLNGVLTCSIPVVVSAGNTGSVFDTLTVSNCCDILRPSNNTATAVVSTTLGNNLTVTANPGPGSTPGGGSTTFTFLVGNSGPSTAFNVSLSNALSPNLTLSAPVSCAPSAGAAAATLVGGVLTSASIPPGGLLTCSVPVTVTAGANGNVFSTFTASAAGDQRTSDNSGTAVTLAVSSDVGVSQTGPAQIAAGNPATFDGFVVNPTGQGTATNLVITWNTSGPPGTTFAPSCLATGGATCPSVLGQTMTLPFLVAGGQLRFSFVATTSATDRGPITSTLSVASDGDPNLGNNAATTTITAVDGRNGSYLVFAADGQPNYSLALAFNDDATSGTYTMTTAGGSAPFSFALDPGGSGDFVVAGSGARFRIAQDIVVGNHNFGSGLVPYVAARSFTSLLGTIAGTYDLATRNVPTAGAATTHAGTAVISGNTLSICQSDTPATVAAVVACDPAARKDYFVSVNGTTFTAQGSGDSFTFQAANIGATKVLLSVGVASDGSQQLRIGVPDSTVGLIPAVLRGADTAGNFQQITLTTTTTGSNYVTSAPVVSAALARVNLSIAGPFGMLTGPRSTDGAAIYVMEAAPLAVTIGGVGTAASGYLQVAVP